MVAIEAARSGLGLGISVELGAWDLELPSRVIAPKTARNPLVFSDDLDHGGAGSPLVGAAGVILYPAIPGLLQLLEVLSTACFKPEILNEFVAQEEIPFVGVPMLKKPSPIKIMLAKGVFDQMKTLTRHGV